MTNCLEQVLTDMTTEFIYLFNKLPIDLKPTGSSLQQLAARSSSASSHPRYLPILMKLQQ